MTTTTPPHVTQTADGRMPGFGTLLGQALLGGALAAVVNLAIFFGGKAAGVPFAGEFQPGQMSELQVPFVAISSIVPGMVGALVALLFLKLTKAAARNFAILATVFAAVLAAFALFAGAFPVGAPQAVKTRAAAAVKTKYLISVINRLLKNTRPPNYGVDI